MSSMFGIGVDCFSRSSLHSSTVSQNARYNIAYKHKLNLHTQFIPTRPAMTTTPPRNGNTPNKKQTTIIKALDAAMPFDYEAQARKKLTQQNKLRIGIVGFGTFGQFLAKRFVQAGHDVLATSRSPYQNIAQEIGVDYYQDSDDFCEEHPDIVIFATSILSMEEVLNNLPVQRLRRNTLFVDVLSVKEFPKLLLLNRLPKEVDILCTHPMFGPDSGKGSWDNLNFQYEKVRVSNKPRNQQRVETFLNFFESEGCRMVEMSCEEHDRLAASTQFLTHTVGRTLGSMGLSRTSIDTKGYQSLMTLVENTNNDSFDLYYGLFMYNKNATEELERLERAFDAVKKQLFDRLHLKLREQMFLVPDNTTNGGTTEQHQPVQQYQYMASSDDDDSPEEEEEEEKGTASGSTAEGTAAPHVWHNPSGSSSGGGTTSNGAR